MDVFLFLNGSDKKCTRCAEHIAEHRKKGDPVLCADGGYYLAVEAGVVPDLVIGDFDSLEKRDVEDGVEVVRFPERKDYSDFELALQFSERYNPACVYVYGALGGRADHALINILLLYRAPFPVVFIDSDMEVYNVRERLVLEGRSGCICSLITFSGDCVVDRMEGFRYTLENETLAPSSRGLSNVITSDRAEISVGGGTLVVMVGT